MCFQSNNIRNPWYYLLKKTKPQFCICMLLICVHNSTSLYIKYLCIFYIYILVWSDSNECCFCRQRSRPETFAERKRRSCWNSWMIWRWNFPSSVLPRLLVELPPNSLRCECLVGVSCVSLFSRVHMLLAWMCCIGRTIVWGPSCVSVPALVWWECGWILAL